MSSAIRHVTIDCTGDPYPVARFWSAVLDLPLHPDDRPGDDEIGIPLPGDRPDLLLFQRVPDAKTVKNRMHFDLMPERTRDEEVERLRGIGATVVGDHRRPDGTGWVTMADPFGNEFCVERGAAERA